MDQDKYSMPILMDNRELRKNCPEFETLSRVLAEDVDDLPKQDGVVRDPQIVEWITCPVCGLPDGRQLFCKQGFIYAQCERCDHIYVQNQVRPKHLHKLYKESRLAKASVQLQQNAYRFDYWTRLYEKYLALMRTLTDPDPGILDVGCGVGNFLQYVSKQTPEWSLHGLELGSDAAPHVTRIVGPDRFYNRPIEDVDFDRSFGQIYLWGVLEHLADPITALKKVCSILSDQGVLFFLIPNVNSLAVRILGVHTPTFQPQSHLQFFTKKSLEWTYAQTGLKEVGVFYELPVIDLMYPFLDYSTELALEINKRGESYYEVHVAKKA